MTSGEINVYVMKLLKMLEAKRKVKEEGRVISPWIFQLLPAFLPQLLMDPTALILAILLADLPPQPLLYLLPSTQSGGWVFFFSSRYLAHKSNSK